MNFLPFFDSISTSVSCLIVKTSFSHFLFCFLFRLYSQCKLDLDSTICSASKNSVSFQFPMQQHDLYAQQEAAG